MELLSGPATVSWFRVATKKRSNFHRRPHPNPMSMNNCLNVFNFPSTSKVYGECIPINLHCSIGDTRMGTGSESCSTPGDCIRSDANEQGGSDQLRNDKKLKKVKLKLGSVTHTLYAKPTTEVALGDGHHHMRSFDSSGVSGTHLKQDIPRNIVLDVNENPSRIDFGQKNDAMYDMGHTGKQIAKNIAVDEEFDDEDDEEIRYLMKLRASRDAYLYRDKLEDTVKRSKGVANLTSVGYSDAKDDQKKKKFYEDNDYEVELTSDDELRSKRKRLRGEFVDPTTWSGQELTMTTRKRALECPESGGLVEFPNGLPAAPSKKPQLSVMEQQLRKAEVAQRRRILAEKAAQEAQAEAIRKILGQDSNRKKENKLKKQQKELAQEKIDKAAALGPNTVRWIMGPHGTVVTFSEDIGLPKILSSLPCRYPPLREKCVGPNCTNEYKYRDSKSKLPLCSLHCFKAVRAEMDFQPAC